MTESRINHMKFLVVGLGSMGKRRIRNLKKIGYSNIIGFDSRLDRLDESKNLYGVRTHSDINDSLLEKPDVMIISTPPDQHLKYAEIAIKNKIPFFTELNLIDTHVKQIEQKSRKNKVFACPSYTMRNHPCVKELKKYIEKKFIGKILLVNHHTGHYLPNWHPWEKPKDFFVSKKNTGGAKELLAADLVWLSYLFPTPKSLFGHVTKISNLKIMSDDVYSSTMELENGIICNILIDVISIPSVKTTKIIGERGTIFCDFIKGKIEISTKSHSKTINIKLGHVAKGYKGITPSESLYEDELESFINSLISKKKYPYTFSEEIKSLKIIKTIEQSSRFKKKLHVF